MNITKKLQEWHAAHLIDAQQMAAIQNYEHNQPTAAHFIWRYGLLGLGVLTIAIGLLAIVASNWNAIPAAAKLSVHLIINAGVAGTLFYLWRTGQSRQWRFEGWLILKTTLVLTLMALLGQILHTQAPLEDTLLLWWCLITPMILLFGRYRPTLLLWAALSVSTLFGQARALEQPLLLYTLFLSLIVCLVTLPLYDFWKRTKPGWSYYGQKLTTASAFLLVNLLLFFPYGHRHGDNYLINSPHLAQTLWTEWAWEIALVMNLMLMYGIAAMRYKTLPLSDLYVKITPSVRIVFAHLATALFLAYVPEWFGWFILYWFIVGYIALRSDDRRVVGLSITLLAIRIIALYFDWTNDLMTTGLLMILSGSLVLYLVKTYPRWRTAVLSATGGVR